MLSRFFIIFFLIIAPLNTSASEAFSLDFPDISENMLKIIAMITVLSVAPSILIICTSFTRIIIILSMLRSALGLQQSPPNIVITSLALFLTLFIMLPTFQSSYEDGIQPLINKDIQESEAIEIIGKHFHKFMIMQTREKDIIGFSEISKTNLDYIQNKEDIPFRILLPAFMVSELRRAFEMGFLIFLPFLIIDLLVASILMAMGMMMLPPVMISLPFKVIFFVLVDGWQLVSAALVKSFILI